MCQLKFVCRRQNAPINENLSRTEVKNLFPFQLLFALWLFQHWFAGVTKIRTEASLGVVRPNMALSHDAYKQPLELKLALAFICWQTTCVEPGTDIRSLTDCAHYEPLSLICPGASPLSHKSFRFFCSNTHCQSSRRRKRNFFWTEALLKCWKLN